MPTYHTVKQGDYLSKIAARYGFADFHGIWDHPENAQLKQRRGNPNILLAGDRLFIPDREEKAESAGTEQRHRFRVKGEPLMLRLAILDFDHQPLADTPCELHLGGRTYALTTDGDGRIEQSIPKDAAEGVLVFNDPSVPFEQAIPIKVGHLDPLDEISGQKDRLNNLGYDAGPPDGTDAERFGIAVQEFQCDYGLTVDGDCGAKTQAKLKEIYGC